MVVNKEALIITPPQEFRLSKSARKHIRIEKSLKHKQEANDYRLYEINSPKKIKERRISIINNIEEYLSSDKDFNQYKNLSLFETKKRIALMEGISFEERKTKETSVDFILKNWGESGSSKKISLYLWFLNKACPQDFNDLMIIDQNNKNKLVLLRDQALGKKSR